MYGTSMDINVRQSKDADHLEIVGHDREHEHAHKGQKMDAFAFHTDGEWLEDCDKKRMTYYE
jgi:hypothetical protein